MAAHLRVGGGTVRARIAWGHEVGASPRGRRNPERIHHAHRRHGRISAWAEEPRWRHDRCRPAWAHLRVGGGTAHKLHDDPRPTGASPRGRRNLVTMAKIVSVHGRISAWAEEPAPRAIPRSATTAHLRVGGGTLAPFASDPDRLGASPRGRRNQPTSYGREGCAGRISAWAEEPRRWRHDRSSPSAHLRVGGGTDDSSPVNRAVAGASPRGRRNPLRPNCRRCASRRISAWAEEPSLERVYTAAREAHLRVGGGTGGNNHARKF